MMDKTNGILVIDKPSGLTSRGAVDRAQAWFPPKTRIGHTGTLDPLANGVLVLCLGAATRLIEYLPATKVYRAGILLGATSDSDDADGVVTTTVTDVEPAREIIERELGTFIGVIDQVPPAFSAAKVTGRRAYKLARKGKEFSLEPRKVRIDRIDVLSYAYPHLELMVRCGKGTYIRSLARDLGRSLGCGGYISSLRRLESDGFTETDAISLESGPELARQKLLPAWRAVQSSSPTVISADEAIKLRQGKRIVPIHQSTGPTALVDDAGNLVAVVESIAGCWQPLKVFPGERPA